MMSKAIMVERSESGHFAIPGAAEIEDWHLVKTNADEVIYIRDLTGWEPWEELYVVKTNTDAPDPADWQESYYFVGDDD